MKTDWMEDAACRRSSLDFYAIHDREDGKVDQRVLDALVLVCNTCPVAPECATFAMRSGDVERWGVWAGSLPARRAALERLGTETAVEKLLVDLAYNADQANYRRKGGRAKRSETTVDFKHGLHGYKNRKCRCEVCLSAWKAYSARGVA